MIKGIHRQYLLEQAVEICDYYNEVLKTSGRKVFNNKERKERFEDNNRFKEKAHTELLEMVDGVS